MALVAEYEIGTERLPLVDVASAVPRVSLYVEIVPTRDGPPPLTLRASSGDDGGLSAALDAAPFVDEVRRIAVADGVHHYQVLPAAGMDAHWDEDFDVGRLRSLAAADAVIDEIEVTPTGWIQTGWFADREVLDEFRTFWQDQGATFAIRRLTREGETAAPGDGLTDRQREALRVAYEMGYFEIPRRARLEAVADELGISASSLSERLRRAQTHLIETSVAATWPTLPE